MSSSPPIIGRLLGHYRVLEQIGAGGMGLVFRAHDEQLERDVAIKVLPAGMLTDEAASKRFRREALALAKLNHPNIATVYEFGSQDGVHYLVMELVSGIPLESKLSAGPLAQKEVLRLGMQLADGLLAAHEQGIVHRDLKPANLRLTRDGRLKILDFGLAQFVRQDSDLGITASVNNAREVTGTLPYMSPEQLRAEATDSRGDLWAAGAVLYEIATGRRAFPQKHAPLIIDSILNKQPEFPTVLNPKISPGLEGIILKCLDKEPERRYQSARELRVDLDRLTAPISQVPGSVAGSASTGITPPVPGIRSSSRKRAIAVTGCIVALLLAASIFYETRHRTAAPTARPVAARRSVAVLGFKNLTGRPEAAWLSTALPEMLTTEIAAGEKVRTISGENVARARIELSLSDTDALGAQTLAQLGRNLGADLVVLGSYVALTGGKIRLDLRLQDVATGAILISLPETGDEGDLFDLVSRAGARLREGCGAGQITNAEAASVKAALPANPEAAKLYAEGIAHLRVFEATAARDLLQKAVAADPNYALAHSALASAWATLGYDEKARESAKSAFDLSAELSREERMLIEARYRETTREWDNATNTYRTLFGFFPDNLEYGVLLARAQIRAGKGKDALATVDSLRRVPSPDRNDSRIDLVAAEAATSLGDFKQAESLAASAADKAHVQSAGLLAARALYLKGLALENLGQSQDAIAPAEEAQRIYAASGDRNGVASTLEVIGNVLADRSNLAGALGKYGEELAIVREVGNRRAESSALNNMALVLAQQGDLEGTRKTWEQALAISREVGDKYNSAMTLLNIGGVLKDQGGLAAARKTYEQALAISREINDQKGIASALTALGTVLDAEGGLGGAKKALDQAVAIDLASGQSGPTGERSVDLGDVLQHQGDLPAARKAYQDGLALSREGGDKSMAAYALMGLGNTALKAADFTEAQKNYDEALALRNDVGEKGNVASTQVAMAALALEEGKSAGMESQLLQAREEFRRTHKYDDEIAATAVLVRVLVAQGKVADARHEVDSVAALAKKSQNLAVHLEFALAKAGADIATLKPGTARNALASALTQASKAGLVGHEFEIRLALEDAESSPKSFQSRSRLQLLEREAKAKGFDLVARKAAARLP